jgi:error-prone DNA polymerase
MARLFHRHPAALRRTLEIADRCAFRLSDLRYQYPDEAQDGEPAQDRLERLTREGLHWRYPAGPPPKIVHRVEKELTLIREVDYAPYFLTVHDIVQFARSKGILCQGRGSAANSVVCYLLGITEVPPESITLIFERFISKERGEPPDIDVDFEHERREEVIQWIYERYGRERAGLTAVVIHFRSRAAIREVGKVMGLPGCDRAALGPDLGLVLAAPGEDRLRDAGLSRRPPHATGRAADRRDHRLSPPSQPACRRLRHHPRAAGRALPDRECRDGGSHHHRMGQGRHRRAWPC